MFRALPLRVRSIRHDLSFVPQFASTDVRWSIRTRRARDKPQLDSLLRSVRNPSRRLQVEDPELDTAADLTTLHYAETDLHLDRAKLELQLLVGGSRHC